MIRILLVDDDLDFLKSVSELLKLHDFSVSTASSVKAGKQLAAEHSFDVFLLDLMLEDGSGIQVLEVCTHPESLPRVAIITGHPIIKTMVSDLYGPDVQYLLKPLDVDLLINFIKGEKAPHAPPSSIPKRAATQDANGQQSLHFGTLLGDSLPMRDLYRNIDSVANTMANVLIQGESGAGKELVAKAIHQASQVNGPFIAANCGAFSRELIGSELFGHEKGAFTGAVARKPGLFEQAHAGTLFLDEITEMPMDLQPNLLRVLETKKVVRVGGREEIPVNCRVISATNRKPEDFAKGDIMREDLFYRLAVFPLDLPPLRARKDDIALLATAFLDELNKESNQHCELSEQQIQQLTDYSWPGNVRELRHMIHRAFILTAPSTTALALPSTISSPFASKERNTQVGTQFGSTIGAMEQELILTTLTKLNGNKQKAAEMLGISLKTLYNRLNSYGLETN